MDGDNSSSNISCKSPHPLLPVFIIKKLLGERSVVHYHWFEFSDIQGFFILLWKLFLLLTYRIVGGNIIWTVHNKHPHRNNFYLLNTHFYKIIAHIAERIHVHCREAVHIMVPVLGVQEDKFYVIEHPYYPVSFVEKEEAVRYIQRNMQITPDISKPVFLMYGFIAPYKGTALVIHTCVKNKLQLIIAGECLKGEDAYLDYIETLVKGKNNIWLRQYFLSAEDEKFLFNAVDCVIFNFKDTLSSGSVILAQSYKKDIIIPHVGCLKEMQGDGIYKFHTKNELEQQLINYTNSFSKKST
jgi:hypothetical protein